MQRKTTWTNYSAIGISIILFCIISCGTTDVEYILRTNFVYRNLISEIVELNVYDIDQNHISYSILPNQELEISSESSGPKNGVGPPFFGSSKIIIKFLNSNLCVENYWKLKDVRQYDNFSESMYNLSDNTLIYNIDKEELDVSEPCD